MAALAWLANMNEAASPVSGPVGPGGAGRELMLRWVGRCVIPLTYIVLSATKVLG